MTDFLSGRYMGLIWKLTRKHLNIRQLVGYMFASFAGVAILLTAIQFYADVSPLLSGGTSLISGDYAIVSKKVNTIKSVRTGRGETFSDREIEDIGNQDFVEDIGIFRSSDFRIYAEIAIGDEKLEIATDIFFESVPNRFVDYSSDDWSFDDERNSVPIILPRNYLDLYNFAFAPSHGMPQISESLARMINIRLYVSGSQSAVLNGHLAGLSDRLNTILVPDSFLEAANEKYGLGTDRQPLRLIVKTDGAVSSGFAEYISDKGYTVADSGDNASRVSVFLRIAVGLVSIIGLVICVISLSILVLSLYLIVEKNIRMYSALCRLGFSPASVSWPFAVVCAGANIIVTAVSVLAVRFFRDLYTERLEAFFMDSSAPEFQWLYAAAAAVFAVSVAISYLLVLNRIRAVEKAPLAR